MSDWIVAGVFCLIVVCEIVTLKWLREIRNLQTAAVGLLLERIRVLTAERDEHRNREESW